MKKIPSMVRTLVVIGAATFGMDASNAQLIYDSELDIDGASQFRLIDLPDGSMLSSGRISWYLHLIKWDQSGDTLWTKSHWGIASHFENPLELLSTGDILTGNAIIDQDGELIMPFIPYGQFQCQLGPDSLLYASGTWEAPHMFVSDRFDNVLWQAPLIHYPGTHTGTISIRINSGILAYTTTTDAENDAFAQAIIMAKYDLNGSFLDSTLIYSSDSGNVKPNFIRPTIDGGALAAISLAHMDNLLIRTDESGDTLWTRLYSAIDPDFNMFLHDALETEDGRFILSGYYDSAPQVVSPRLVELNSEGDMLCVEDLDASYAFDIMVPKSYLFNRSAQGPDGILHLLYSGIGNVEPHVHMRGFGQFCLDTDAADLKPLETIGLMTLSNEFLLTGTMPQMLWSLHDNRGLQVDHGTVTAVR